MIAINKGLKARFYHVRENSHLNNYLFYYLLDALNEGQIKEYRGNSFSFPSFKSAPEARAVTVCDIFPRRKFKKEPLARGFAFCSSKDKFSRKVGRNLALKRALFSLKKNREDE